MMCGDAPNVKPGSAAWSARADELAAWAWRLLVNRADVWGGYWAGPDGAVNRMTRPAVKRRGSAFLDEGVLARHFRARRPDDVVGLHTTSPDNLSRWGALDIDRHGPTAGDPGVNLRAALAWHDRLAALGFRPLLTDSNGAGGFHLRVLLASPVPTPRLHRFLGTLAADHRRHGLAAPPELFPKQAGVEPGRFGNWLRVPGRHHGRDHWPAAWDGARWLGGPEAVAFVLTLQGDPPSLVPEPPPPRPRPARPRRPATPPDGALAKRAAAYLKRLPNRGEGEGRDDVAYQFAAFLVRDLALADPVALDWLALWDAGNSPPKGRERLAEVIASARRYGRRAVGSGLNEASGGRHPPRGHYTMRFTVEVR
jgi:hypothetical protein